MTRFASPQPAPRSAALAVWLFCIVISVSAQESIGPQPPPPFAPLEYPVIEPTVPAPSLNPPVAVPSGWGAGQSTSGGFGALASLPTTVAAGRTPATFAVSNSGAANYTIPLWSPPGVGEVQLKLALVYSSRSGNGVLGQGWALSGLSAITRCNKNIAQDGAAGGVTNTLSDRFCLDGQQLKVVSGTPGLPGSVYAPEIESFSKIVANGPQTGNGPASFTVTTKNGLVYDYGGTTDSKIFAGNTGTIRTWALSQIRDRAQGSSGNYIALAYLNEAQNGNYTNGSYRIASITYPTTTTGQGPFYQVLFSYVARPTTDIVSGYLAGYAVREPNELTTITIQNYGAGSPIKTYNFSYDSGPATNRRRLTTIQECSAASCFPATTISYQSGSQGWSGAVGAVGVSSSANANPRPVDLNGDGLEDILYPVTVTSSTVRWWVVFATTTGYGAPVNTGITTDNGANLIFGDFAGIGRTQFLAIQGGLWYVVGYSTSGFVSSSTGLAPSGEIMAADVDGDGLSDLVSRINKTIYVRRNTTMPVPGSITAQFSASTESVWTAPSNRNMPYGPYYYKQMDWNGDGRADLLIFTSVNSTKREQVFGTPLISNGFGVAFTVGTQILVGELTTVALGDWNNDGCTDVLQMWDVEVSNCQAGYNQFSTGITGYPSALMPTDWDGDGRMDFLYVNASTNNTWYLVKSTGEGASPAMATGIAAPLNTKWFVHDQDGDGLTDLGFVDGGAGNAIKYRLHNGSTVMADLANNFVDGFGINQSPTYKTITRNNYTKYSDAAFPEQDYQAPLYVVDQFTASDGTGSTYQNQLWYYGARIHVQGRGFEGFNTQRVYDTRNGLYTYDYVARTFPYTGIPTQRLVYQTNGTTQIASLSSSVSYQISGGSGYEQRYFPFVSGTTDYRYEVGGSLNGSLVTQTTTSYTYGDSYGNPTQIVTSATDKDPYSPFLNTTWQTTVNRTYSNNTAYNCFGLPLTASVTNAVPGQSTQTRSYSFAVDSSACRVWQQAIEPSIPAQKVTTTLGFDTCGNVSSVQVVGSKPDGAAMPERTTTFGFGTRCQLPESVTNALSQTTSLTYNYDFGVPASVTDPNIIATSWLYDDFGRPTRENRPDGTKTDWTYSYCGTPPCWGVNDLRFLVSEYPLDTAGGPINTRYLFYDGMDRLRYDESYRVLGVWTNEIFLYDSLGRLTARYQPFSSASNGYFSWSYDALNRVTAERLYQPSGALDRTTSIAYAGRSTSVTDPLIRVTQRIADVTGQLRRVIDPSPGGTTYYDHDAFGNLNRIQDPIGAVSTGIYNLRGFRTQWADADRGLWNFSGNSLNELVSWTDAKSQAFNATYDALGRMTSRTEPEGTSLWTWGASAVNHNIGALQAVSGYGFAESRTYDTIGRLATRAISTDQTYQYDYSYNPIGALDTLTYPTSPIPSGQTGSRFKTKYVYSYGAPYQIQDVTQVTPTTLWTLTEANDYSSPTSETLNTIPIATSVTSGYKAWTNELTSIQSGVGTGVQTNRQNLAYQWDTVGNLMQRQDLSQGLTEVFTPDALNRVLSSTLNGTPNLTMGYNAAGDIQSKTGVGTYSYGDSNHPHAVTVAGSNSFTYDANGNAATRNGLGQTWASFNLPTMLQATINGSTWQSQFWYGPEHQRWKQVATYTNGTETTLYVGGLLEKMHATSTGLTYWRHYVPTPSGLTIIVSRNSNNTGWSTYALSDHLGGSEALLDDVGDLIVRESFGAFGARRGSDWSISTPPDWTGIADTTRRGFTFHEMLDNINLIHMNGRVYDPTVGRFLSVDPIIGDLADSQSVNAYSYVGNRPLSWTDPTGLEFICNQWCVRVIESVVTSALNFLFGGSSPPPPPPATSLPGISAQDGVMECAPGSSSPACTGLILYVQAPTLGDNGSATSSGPDDRTSSPTVRSPSVDIARQIQTATDEIAIQAAIAKLIKAQDAAIHDPKFEPGVNTYCNLATCSVATTVGAPMGPLTDAHGTPLLANQIRENLAQPRSGYKEISADEAQRLANQGRLVIVTGPGHVATVRPDTGQKIPGHGPLIANVGQKNGVMRLSRVFRSSVLPDVKFYVPD